MFVCSTCKENDQVNDGNNGQHQAYKALNKFALQIGLKFFYQNIDGLLSKLDSIKDLPSIRSSIVGYIQICFVHLTE